MGDALASRPGFTRLEAGWASSHAVQKISLRLVRDHARDAVLVGLADHLRHIALALTLSRLRGQDVTLERLTALDLAGCRLLESFGGAGMSFHFWHFCSFGASRSLFLFQNKLCRLQFRLTPDS